jgi:DNA invertase Pin-like site-specific DNA recombinase
MTMRAALYLRVSTTRKRTDKDGREVVSQTTENQRLELERVAAARGWTIVGEYADTGLSGAKGRDKRPQLDRLYRDATAGTFDVIMSWSIDRIGRSLQHLCGFMAEMDSLGVKIYLHQQAIDTSTPAGRMVVQMAGVFAEFERAMLQERIHAGIARARRVGTKSGKAIGRPTLPTHVASAVRTLHGRRMSIRAIAGELSISTTTVQKVLAA